MFKEVLKMEEKTKKSKKSKVLASVAAVVLALSMLLGAGTYAYLTDETDDVTNTFSTNQVTVDLEETTGDDYEIVPGTSQAKDPTVTVTNTVDAYVFVEVTDTTDGLVEYAIADGWTLLDGYDNVYYRVVSADDETKSFSVLAGDTVYYSAALENSDMLDEEGNLKDGLELTFKAYAIQMEPFASNVEAAYAAAKGETTIAVDADSLQDSIDSGESYIVVNEDIETDESITIPSGADVTLILSGTTITNTTNDAIVVEDGGTLSITGGTVDATAHGKAAIRNNQGGTVVAENVTFTRSQEAGTGSSDNGGNSYYVVLNQGTMTFKTGTVVIGNGHYSSLIENGWYYPADNSAGEYAYLTIEDGTYIGGLYSVKNDDYGILTINNGTFENEYPALLNYGTATINNGTFSTEYVAYCPIGGIQAGELYINGGDFTYSSSYAIVLGGEATAEITNATFNGISYSEEMYAEIVVAQ